jgi:transposase InsO family protein
MMVDEDQSGRWARLRFLVVGSLLADPPKRGMLKAALRRLSEQKWKHPITGEITTFGVSTIERWYYRASCVNDPIVALRRQIRSDAGNNRALIGQLLIELEHQYRQHPSWSYQLHADNLVALVEEQPSLGSIPSYSTVRRTMKKKGWLKRPRKAKTAGQRRAQERLENREVRSYEASHAHALWHIDGHKAHRKIIDSNGNWYQPTCICILDDFSRLGCHVQWYSTESSETVNHTFMQAFLKRGLPRGNLSDNGGGMTSEEITNGLSELGITAETTLEYSPYQNGKQESFWGQIEGRLMPMLESVEPLTLEFLNRTTQAWIEQEYNRSRHDQT